MVGDTPKRRYFDNAATTFPKPDVMAEAVHHYLTEVGASAGRGAYREALESQEILEDCRVAVREFFGCAPEDEVLFTLNGTDALNIAIKGLVGAGDHVVTSRMDHNSVLRPLSALAERSGVTWTAVEVDAATRLDPQAVADAITERTRLVAINHASNVTGALQPIEEIAEVCRARSVPLLVDAAQSAGHVAIDLSRTPIDLLACPGHKGLLGPLGTGILVLRAGMAERVATLREGGTGSQSESAQHPEVLPDKFEPGSHNAVGIAGLLASLRWLLNRGVRELRVHETLLCERMMARLEEIDGLRWYGPRRANDRVGVFSVRLDGLEPDELSAVLETQFGLLTRSGLHCAPLAHASIGTHTSGGTTRFSFGPFLDEADIDAAGAALHEIARHLQPTA